MIAFICRTAFCAILRTIFTRWTLLIKVLVWGTGYTRSWWLLPIIFTFAFLAIVIRRAGLAMWGTCTATISILIIWSWTTSAFSVRFTSCTTSRTIFAWAWLIEILSIAAFCWNTLFFTSNEFITSVRGLAIIICSTFLAMWHTGTARSRIYIIVIITFLAVCCWITILAIWSAVCTFIRSSIKILSWITSILSARFSVGNINISIITSCAISLRSTFFAILLAFVWFTLHCVHCVGSTSWVQIISGGFLCARVFRSALCAASWAGCTDSSLAIKVLTCVACIIHTLLFAWNICIASITCLTRIGFFAFNTMGNTLLTLCSTQIIGISTTQACSRGTASTASSCASFAFFACLIIILISTCTACIVS